MTASSRLLILSCAKAKRDDPELLPAIERYDGPAFRLLRRFLRSAPWQSLDVYVLSAQLGLIASSEPIPNYDRLMTQERARELQPGVTAALEAITHAGAYQEMLVWTGTGYAVALEGYAGLMPEGLTIRSAEGAIGKKLAILYDWLYGAPPDKPEAARAKGQSQVSLRGVVVKATREQALAVARQALVAGEAEAQRYHAWYVSVDGGRVAPKWLIGQLTGLPPGGFATTEARRVLAQLEIEVRRA